MNKSAFIYIVFIILSFIRSFQLYWTSTRELRSTTKRQWLPTKRTKSLPLLPRNDSIIIKNEPNELFYFIHVTDLHLSRYRAKGHTSHFLHFIQSILPVIKPEFVVVTGDLTDAKDRKRITSQQYLDEWDVYQQAINEKVRVDWFDIRGNHDCFDLPSWKSRINYYRTHGQSASLVEQGKGIYTWQVNKQIGNYQFVAIDACPKRGPSRPLNFFGYLTSRTMDRLEKALTWKQFNHTFVFSHYPTTTMVFGLGDVLQSYNTVTKSLELELGDMKEHGLYRIVAVDHDLISFTDLQLPLNQIPKKISSNKHGLVYPMVQDGNATKVVWPEPIHPSPSILITNPKDARYSIPSKEPLWRIQSSTHIRFLIFSELEDPTQLKVSVYIDGSPHPHEATFAQDKLWTAPWNTSLLDPRTHHTLTIRAETPDGAKGASTVLFRVDGQRMNIGGGPGEFIIKSHMSSFVSPKAKLSHLLKTKRKRKLTFVCFSYNL
ncbi:Metallo-dependent phosphatase [Rhizopus microsporus var. microsporus]|uniref:Metallo-dependent phosphatase n=1 Tax=Rhizopus microsporus var. microsporus TaxID=86635 RepID=A0A1X0QZL2_RHIZD|nr:Metallo-dependent phosphatase [Rhizopus microsporus var. microsporus]